MRRLPVLVCLLALSPLAKARTAQLAPDPDPALSPGVARPLTRAQMCSTAWSRDVRHVSSAMKRRVYAEYDFPAGNADPRCPCAIDHRIPREIGGADVLGNLMVQSYRGACNAHDKDRLENAVHREVCASSMTVDEAHAVFLGDWKAGYLAMFGQECK